MEKIKAVIFDLNGVFIVSRKLSDRFLRDFGVAEDIFLPALKEVMGKTRQPAAENAYSYWKPYLEKWRVPLDEKQFFGYWFSAEQADRAMVAIAQALKQKNIPLFILSNNLRERTKYYQDKFPFLSTFFTKVYYSWQTGYIKPDPRAYELLLRENNLRPGECLYFDDSEANVAVANRIGIQSYLFMGSVGVKEKIVELLNA